MKFSPQIPKFLAPGDLIRGIAPAGKVKEQELISQGHDRWRTWGYEFDFTPPLEPWHYLANSDRERCREFDRAWKSGGAIMAVRGGYGSMRLLEQINWQKLENRAPWLIGFSDITALLWAMATKLDLMGIHGPVLITLSQESPRSQQALIDCLTGNLSQLTLTGESWRSGVARGKLLPGNLTVATHLLGTPFIPPWDKIILAIEDVSEPLYKLDRMLTQWRLSGAFDRVVGIALGRFTDTGDTSDMTDRILQDRLLDLNIPIVGHLPFGHGGDNYPLPVGCNCTLEGDRGELTWELPSP